MDGKFLAWRAYEKGEDRGVILSGLETISYDTALRRASTYVPNSLDVVPTSILGFAVLIVVFIRDMTVGGMFVVKVGEQLFVRRVNFL